MRYFCWMIASLAFVIGVKAIYDGDFVDGPLSLGLGVLMAFLSRFAKDKQI